MKHFTRAGSALGAALAASLAVISPGALAAVSITTSHDGGNPARPIYTIDTDAGLVFKVRGYDNGVSTQSAGDISSLVYQGVQFQDQSRGSQLNSGADFLYKGVSAVAVKAELVDAEGVATPASIENGGVVRGEDYVKITLISDNLAGGVLTHYYLVKKGQPHIHMGTHFTAEPDTLNLVRYIVRVPIAALPNGGSAGTPGGLSADGYWPGDLRGSNGAIEASDVFGFAATDARHGQSRSKHYSNMRLKDWHYFGGTGNKVGLWMLRGNNEGNSGGPFYRSLLTQITASNNELTYIVNYGEAQTEPFRFNILNSYTLMFTDGAPPVVPDTGWFDKLDLVGYVAPQARGAVTVAGLEGRKPGIAYSVGFANTHAQYWADADGETGAFSSVGMLPGDYTMSIFKNELAVATRQVSVAANAEKSLGPITLADDPDDTPALWRIGSWDGTPAEFLNGDKLTTMHPSDVRMAPWVLPDYRIGQADPASGFAAYQWKDVNGAISIRFTLRRGQTRPLTLRIGTTTEMGGARPQVKVNGWTSAVPPATPKTTRNLTVGTYRGINRLYRYDIPARELLVGENVVTISPVSGTAGLRFLSPGIAYDALDLIATPQ
ncbi:polysaccharide lyase family protein [Paucibacter sp. PLA-PC-4]|uniref:rhamnogalacturonan lyase B N-terminal domain-containing protein n=1 Tax=Paucibacter sp. PLA-PC-4 TaxID=2993655 RepID=UPI00224AEB59|nr:rhamnogalacturonan lyase B N-terminal domain-containing protein [Paucibacter sp. PLA-PC-4]MCX2865059.1 polysaccharide lyase family protein [Paucibacter sp. PLA-PC-4]